MIKKEFDIWEVFSNLTSIAVWWSGQPFPNITDVPGSNPGTGIDVCEEIGQENSGKTEKRKSTHRPRVTPIPIMRNIR